MNGRLVACDMYVRCNITHTLSTARVQQCAKLVEAWYGVCG